MGPPAPNIAGGDVGDRGPSGGCTSSFRASLTCDRSLTVRAGGSMMMVVKRIAMRGGVWGPIQTRDYDKRIFTSITLHNAYGPPFRMFNALIGIWQRYKTQIVQIIV